MTTTCGLVTGRRNEAAPFAVGIFLRSFVVRFQMPVAEPRMVVLVVEDETLVRMFMADFLDEAGFKVFEAVHADEALTVLQARPDIQAVITDIEMPAGSMNGLKLAQTIQERWPAQNPVRTLSRTGFLNGLLTILARPCSG